VLLTCEHATERLPEGWRWGEDERLRGTHWSHDLGALDLMHELADALGASAIWSRFTRLLADPNRPEDSDTLFRTVAEGEPVALNVDLEHADRERRLAHYYRPYHEAVEVAARETSANLMFSVHSFTELYEGEPRSLEVGVLFDTEDVLAAEMARRLTAAGFRTALNEPYSGKEGLIYSVDLHARRHGRRPLEI